MSNPDLVPNSNDPSSSAHECNADILDISKSRSKDESSHDGKNYLNVHNPDVLVTPVIPTDSCSKPEKPKSLPSSYRSVALISHLGKVLESVINEQLQDFIETNSLLSNNQHGFCKNKSCISQLLIHSEMIMKAIENGNNLDSVYLNFQKAFD